MENKPKTSRAQEFIDAFQLGLEAWKEAGRIVVEELEKNPNFAHEVHTLSKGLVSAEMVQQFELIGRNKVLPQLLLDYKRPGVKKLMVMPIHLQEKYAASPVAVVVFNGEGHTDILNIHPRNMTSAQVQQVFGHNEIRTTAAQRSWLESQRTTTRVKSSTVASNKEPDFTIKGDVITFTKPCKFTIAELMKILVNRK